MKLRNPIFLAILIVLVTSAFTGAGLLLGQQAGITGVITGGDSSPKIAVSDFRGTGAAQPLMGVFNETLWNDLADSGFFEMVAKTFYPLEVPQRPADFRPPTQAGAHTGPWLTDWSASPVSANYLAFGYAAAEGKDLRVYGYLFNVGQADIRTAQVIGNTYFASLDEAGARRNAHEFAKDILKQMGVKSLVGSKITYVSDRSGNQEIWSMDYDGTNTKQITSYKSISKMPAVSPDGKRVALATLVGGQSWQIRVHSTETSGRMTFVSPSSSFLSTPEFTPDGSKIWFSVALNDRQQLMKANIDGGNLSPVLSRDETNLSARINPKNADEVVFISGRGGPPQLYKMNADGSGQQLLTDGTGDVANPAWSPDGTKIAFAWTRGYAPGNFNIFIMDMASKKLVQLTKENGSNENPWWAPDGAHLVYSNTRGRSTQLYTMLANGTRVKQLTSQGNNRQAVWSKAIE